jgi:hypothetical protein
MHRLLINNEYAISSPKSKSTNEMSPTTQDTKKTIVRLMNPQLAHNVGVLALVSENGIVNLAGALNSHISVLMSSHLLELLQKTALTPPGPALGSSAGSSEKLFELAFAHVCLSVVGVPEMPATAP